jgi:CRP/FNR family transcriptional regulator, cyclic AMP receptor protein
VDDSDDIAAIAAALGCQHEAARALLETGRLSTMASGTTLVLQGDIASRSWLILDGAVRCEVISPEGRITVVATHPPGDVVGAFGLPDTPMAGALATSGQTRLLSLGDGVIERLAESDPDFALALARTYARQAGQMMQRLAARISLTAPGRIYARLLELAGPTYSIEPSPIVSALAVSVQTTRETTSRTLSALERRGIIKRDEVRLTIQSPRMLEELIV